MLIPLSHSSKASLIMFSAYTGLDIGYVPAGLHAFLRLLGQFGPLQLIFHWPEGPVDFILFYFFFFSASYAAIIFTGNRQNSEGNVNSYLFFRYI